MCRHLSSASIWMTAEGPPPSVVGNGGTPRASVEAVQPPAAHTFGSETGMTATARHLAALPDDARRAVLAGLTEAELAALEYEWRFWARPDQLPPQDVEWRTFLMLGGRGSGKTRAAAEWVRAEIESGRRRQIGVIAPTADTLRRICVEGPSGLLMTSPPWNRPQFEPSTRRVVYPGGGVVHLFSAEEPDRLRGPNLDGLWIDELTSMANANECWDMAQMALRITGPKGDAPACVITTTPKPSPLLKMIMASPTTVVTRAKTVDNAANLDAGHTAISSRSIRRYQAGSAGNGCRTIRRCRGCAVVPQPDRPVQD